MNDIILTIPYSETEQTAVVGRAIVGEAVVGQRYALDEITLKAPTEETIILRSGIDGK